MPAIDFTEIPPATSGPGRDRFELLARDFLEFIGFSVIEGPDRGADGGRDLIVEELRAGVGGETRVRWLVSCKHKCHSGISVSPADEPDIQDRLNAKGCSAFLGFYSTVPSGGLTGKLKGASDKFPSQIYDPERIERDLLHSSKGLQIARRYFPESARRWTESDRKPAKLFADEPKLQCDHCGKSLLAYDFRGIVTLWHPVADYGATTIKRTEHVCFACKGSCNNHLSRPLLASGLIDTWEDISDLLIPTVYLRWSLSTLHKLYDGHHYSDQAFKKTIDLLANLFPMVCRNLSDEDKQRMETLQEIPSFLGGFGG